MQRSRLLVAVLALVFALLTLMLWWRSLEQDVAVRAPTAPSTTTPAPAERPSRGTTPTQNSVATSPTTTSASPTTGAPTAKNSGSAPAATPSTGASTGTASGPLPDGCATAASPIVPTRITMGDVTADSPVLSLGMADDGSVKTPPFDQPHSVGWFNGGPQPGSSQGKVVLTAHTFHKGGALGNALHDSSSGLKLGDLIRVTDASGKTLCYRYTKQAKLWVKDYDPRSTAVYDTAGRPMLAIVICWDWDAARKFWDSRVVYYAEPLAA
ncbi:class F sortase [Luteococcus sp. H138]|uniref:class F sortase n=1 Tax=unclassified Luteococcus TaxID=2639923 RepID=UPI00313C2F78